MHKLPLNGRSSKRLNYETFIQEVALEFSKQLPEELKEYEVVVHYTNAGGLKNAGITLEKENGKCMKALDLMPYYKIYKKGIEWKILVRNIVINFMELNKENAEEQEKNNTSANAKLTGALILTSIISGLIIVKQLLKSRDGKV